MKHIFKALFFIVLSTGLFSLYSSDIIETETLIVKTINDPGFGDLTNQYAWSMETFKDAVYVGTMNVKNTVPGMGLFASAMPFLSTGAQIFKGKRSGKKGWHWKKVVDKGNGNISNYGIRKMKVIGDYLYALTANHRSGFELWRTCNGTQWEIVVKSGFSNNDNTSGRGLIKYNGYIYLGIENRNTGAQIWRRKIDESGDFIHDSVWQQVEDGGFENINNYWFSDFAEFNGKLYTGTLNPEGMELWRTDDGINYERLFEKGNGNPDNIGAMKLYVYNQQLYIGTMNWFDGAYLYSNIDHDGKIFKSVIENGMGNSKNNYIWYLKEYNNRLYAGTFKLNDTGFDLYSAIIPGADQWVHETSDSFNNPEHYGIRSMSIYRGRLIIGSATAEKNEGCLIFEAKMK